MDREQQQEPLAELMADYLAGDIEAFDGLYAACAGRIRAYLLAQCRNAAVADDLLQETFLQMHRSRHTFQPGRPLLPWLFAVARHVYQMQRRGAWRRGRFEDRLALGATETDPARRADAEMIDRDLLDRALAGVPDDQRQAVLMHHVEGRSFQEIAAALGIRVNAAKTRAFRGLKKMRQRVAHEAKP